MFQMGPNPEILTERQIIQKQNTFTSLESIELLSKPQVQSKSNSHQSQIINQTMFDQKNQMKSSKQNFMKFVRLQQIIKNVVDNFFTNSHIAPRFLTKQLHQFQQILITPFLYRSIKQRQKNFLDTQKIFKPFNPFSLIVNLFDSIIIIYLLICLWITAFNLSFLDGDIAEIYVVLAITIILFDALVQLNKGFLSQGEVVFERDRIMYKYLKEYAIEDILMILFWLVYLINLIQISGLREIIYVFQMIGLINRLRKKTSSIFDQFYFKGQYNDLIDLINMIVIIYFFAHIIACAWHYVALKTEFMNQSWLIQHDLQNESAWIKYDASFYWATLTMVTVGYGDIVPVNYVEQIVASIIMFISTIIFAYSMNQIGIIVKNINDQKVQQKRIQIMINNYMKKHEVNPALQERVRNYLKYQMQQENEDEEDVNKILDSLPFSLKVEVEQQIQKQIISQFKLLFKLFSEGSLVKSIKHMEKQRFIPGEIIFNKEQNNQNIYLIQEGEVQLVEQQSGMELQVLKKGDAFGEYSFFTQQATKLAAMSVGFTEIYSINREIFLQIIKDNRKDFEKFHHIKDSLLFQGNMSSIGLFCNFCKSQYHLNINCPQIQFIPNLERLVVSEQFKPIIKNKRDTQFKRLFKLKFKAIINSKFVTEKAKDTQTKNNLVYQSHDGESLLFRLSRQYSEQTEDLPPPESPKNISVDEFNKFLPVPLKNVRQSSFKSISSRKQVVRSQPKQFTLNRKSESPQQAPIQSTNDKRRTFILSQFGSKHFQQQQLLSQEQQLDSTKQIQNFTSSNYIPEPEPSLTHLQNSKIKIFKQTLEQESQQFDQQYNFSFYKPQHNIQSILKTVKPKIRVNIGNKRYSLFFKVTQSGKRLRKVLSIYNSRNNLII
ncbi:hypothetical protein pb186bvf_015672 [Paramecium bursaria]